MSHYVKDYYETSAERGNATAQFLWARCYELGLYGIEKNPKIAGIWYGKSAIQKHNHAETARLAFERLAPGTKLPEPTVVVRDVAMLKFSFWHSDATYAAGASGEVAEMTRLNVYAEESGEPERTAVLAEAIEVEMDEIPSFGRV